MGAGIRPLGAAAPRGCPPAPMRSEPGAPMTLGNAAAAGVRLIVRFSIRRHILDGWCRAEDGWCRAENV
jgi:hypothetical protein